MAFDEGLAGFDERENGVITRDGRSVIDGQEPWMPP